MPENTIAVLSAKQKISAKQKASVLQKMQMKKEERKLERSKSPAEKAEITPFFVLAAVIMLAMAVISLIPLLWMIRTALVPRADSLDLYKLSVPTLENIKRILDAAPFGTYYINTILMVAATLAVQFFSVTTAGYAFARINFIGKNFLFMLFLTQMMISADVLIMPNYRFLSSLGLADTKIGVILPFFVSAMGILMMRQTIKTIPYELEEAAKIDGCGLPRMIWNIYIPLLKPFRTYLRFLPVEQFPLAAGNDKFREEPSPYSWSGYICNAGRNRCKLERCVRRNSYRCVPSADNLHHLPETVC